MRRAAMLAALASLVAACHNAPRKEDEEAAKNTWACELAGERILVRLERGEVRLLMANGERVNLYQVPSASAAGARYTNGELDLVGRGLDLTISRQGGPAQPIQSCKPLVPAKS